MWIIVVAVLLRLGFLALSVHNNGSDALVSGDAIGYLELARNLASGNGFVSPVDGVLAPEVFRAPGLPLLIAPFAILPFGIIIYGALLSLLAGVLLPFLTYHIGTRITTDKAALIAAGLVSIEPHLVIHSFLPLSEMPFTLFALGGFLAALVAHEKSSYRFSLLAGALLGCAVLIRPGFLHIFLVLAIGAWLVLFLSKDTRQRYVIAMLAMAVVILAPWYARNYEVTGALSLSGQGWRNVYTDYLASVRALKKGTSFGDEKNKLKDEALPRFGLSRAEVGNPANSKILRDAALEELWRSKTTVVKLETALLASFFLQDGYYYAFRKYGFLTDTPEPHASPTYEFLTKGIGGGISATTQELARQKFIPLFGRLFTIAVFAGAILGFFLARGRLRYIIAGTIILTALISTVIGLGIEARLRVPVEPFLFILASAAVMWIVRRYQIKFKYGN